MRILLATLLALSLLVPATAAAQAPAVTTGAAQPVGATGATLTGTVDPNGTATPYHFEYGPTTAYGSWSPTATTPATDGDIAVQAPLTGLASNTTYHYRLVAGDAEGADRTFRTGELPGISRLSALDKTPTSARATALVDPNRAETTYHVEWGTSTRFGNATPDLTIPAGDGNVAISVPLAGLPSHTKIYWRVVATNAAGVKRSGTASFTTLRALTGITLGAFPGITGWSGTVSLSGRVRGAGVNGLTVALEQTAFPFTAAFQEVARTRSNKSGEFRFPARQVFIATRYRAVTRTAVSVTSRVTGALVRARVGIRRTRKSRRALHLTGRVHPGLPAGRATLQRRTRSGGWAFVRRKALSDVDASTSTYRFKVRRLRRHAVYRVKVAANDGGAHAGAISRALLVGKKKKRR